MDPISITTGAFAILEVIGSTTKKLVELRSAYNRFDSELEGLLKVVNNLERTVISVASFCAANESFLSRPSANARQQVADIFENVNGFFSEAQDLIGDLRVLILDLQGDPNANPTFQRVDKFKRVLRRDKREDEMNDVRQRIRDCYSAIQVSMTALDLAAVQAAKDSTNESIEGSEERIVDNISRLKLELLAKFAEFGDSIAEKASAAAKISTMLQVNQFFEVSQTVTSHFTGREDLLADLRTAFHVRDANYADLNQRRFVISGVAGSGKSQFSFRFAADVRNYFWGIFFIDASTPGTAENDFGKIAKCAERGATSMKAAMEWLASRRAPWLLIIDNADSINAEEYFPGGSYGCILVTTRNPALQALGTAGNGHYHFDELKHEDAQKLLLRAAAVKMPCTEPSILKAASQISEKMCYLPLALNYAGITIRQRLCGWADYLSWYKRQQKRSAPAKRRKITDFKHSSWAVFHNFEALLSQMMRIADANPESDIARSMRDAMDLLNLFAFFHHRDIRLDILLQCIENPFKEKAIHSHNEGDVPRSGARSAAKKRVVDAVEWVRGQAVYKRLLQAPIVLPPVLRDYIDATEDKRLEAKFRIQLALSELASRSLISDPGNDGIFSIHPLIHSFCRDRLGDATEALWCEAAQVVLARCVIIEVKLFTGGKSDFFNPRQLIPHVEYCRRAAAELQGRFRDKWESRGLLGRSLAPKPVVKDLPPRHDPARWIRFSVIYSQCGRLKESYRLQKTIRDMSVAARGIDHEISIRLSLATAIQNNWLGDFRQCVQMQREAVAGCIELYGKDHPTTLKYHDHLGMMLLAAGRLNECSKNLHLARDGLLAHPDRGAAHKDTLIAMSHLALVEMMYFRPEQARELSERAVKGLRNLDDADTDLLDAKQSQAMALTRLGGKHLEEAHRLQEEVLSTRVKVHGRENPYALLARLCMSRVLFEEGEYHRAEMLLLWGIEVGIRDLTEEHYGVLAGQSTLARIYEAQGKFDKAEQMFDHVNYTLKILRARHNHDHVDRILHLWYFLKFYETQERWQKALDIHAELLRAVETVDESYTDEKLGKKHRMHRMLLEKQPELQKALEAQRKSGSDGEVSRSGSPTHGTTTLRKRTHGKSRSQIPIDVETANAGGSSTISPVSSIGSPPPAYDDHRFSRQNSLEKRSENPVPFRRVRTDPHYLTQV